MHQLTKDPSSVVSIAGKTASSPARMLSRVEVARYLDYCSEMLSLTSKVAVLFAQGFPEPTVTEAVSDIERICRRPVAEDLAEDQHPRGAGAGGWASAVRQCTDDMTDD